MTHVRDDGDESMCDGERESIRSAKLKAVLHQREAVLPAEHTHVSQQVQRNLHILRQTHTHVRPCNNHLKHTKNKENTVFSNSMIVL